jgi:hypothetical protein
LTAILPPVILTVVLRPVTFGAVDFLPAGPTPIIFALLAQYHAMVPHLYKYKVALATSGPTNDDTTGLTLSNKSYLYLLALQLALFQWPGSLLGGLVGWVVGYSWRNELLPGALTRWRLPGWMVGVKGHKRSEGFEGMRRRLEGESSTTGMASGVQQGSGEGEATRRRTMGQQIMDQVREAF